MAQHRSAHRVHAHADLEPVGRLLPIPGECSVGRAVDQAEVDLDLASVDRNRRVGLLLAMVGQQAAEAQGRQQIAVHDQERFGEAVAQQRERTGGAERLVLMAIADMHTVLTPVADDRHQQLGEVTGRQHDLPKALRGQLAQQDFQHRLLAERHERFREHRRQRLEPGTASAGKQRHHHLFVRGLGHLSYTP